MKTGTAIAVAGLGVAALSLSSCYTVLKSPYAADDAREDARYSRWEENLDDDPYAPTIGRFDDGDRWDSPYDYGRRGYPVFGYNSGYGAYGMGAFGSPYGGYGGYGAPYGYGGGYNPYNYGYGPYGYGYDPYYLNPDGVYVPPGYELVTTSELERLREDIQSLNSPQDHLLPTIDEEAMRMQRIETDRQTWQRRNTPRATTRTARTTPRESTSTSSAPAAKKKGSEKSSGESSAGSRRSRR